ncbi:hypothetical protein V8D89_004253 [Ganoderma adspersum]
MQRERVGESSESLGSWEGRVPLTRARDRHPRASASQQLEATVLGVAIRTVLIMRVISSPSRAATIELIFTCLLSSEKNGMGSKREPIVLIEVVSRLLFTKRLDAHSRETPESLWSDLPRCRLEWSRGTLEDSDSAAALASNLGTQVFWQEVVLDVEIRKGRMQMLSKVMLWRIEHAEAEMYERGLEPAWLYRTRVLPRPKSGTYIDGRWFWVIAEQNFWRQWA